MRCNDEDSTRLRTHQESPELATTVCACISRSVLECPRRLCAAGPEAGPFHPKVTKVVGVLYHVLIAAKSPILNRASGPANLSLPHFPFPQTVSSVHTNDTSPLFTQRPVVAIQRPYDRQQRCSNELAQAISSRDLC